MSQHSQLSNHTSGTADKFGNHSTSYSIRWRHSFSLRSWVLGRNVFLLHSTLAPSRTLHQPFPPLRFFWAVLRWLVRHRSHIRSIHPAKLILQSTNVAIWIVREQVLPVSICREKKTQKKKKKKRKKKRKCWLSCCCCFTYQISFKGERKRVKPALEPSAPSDRSLTQILWNEATRRVATPLGWMPIQYRSLPIQRDGLTLTCDQDRISRHNISKISSIQVMRIKKKINLGIISWTNPSS